MIFATGDIHGVPWQVYKFAKKHKLTYDDVIIIPDDVGANFYGGESRIGMPHFFASAANNFTTSSGIVS